MRSSPGVSLLFVSLLVTGGGVARAQVNPVVMPPDEPMQRATPGFSAQAGLFAAIPGDDIADGVDTSGGIRGALAWHFNPNISVHTAFRFIVVNVKDAPDSVDVTYFDLGLGARYTQPLNPLISVYGEFELLASQVKVSSGPFSNTDEDPGFAVRVGGLYKVAPRIDLSGFAGVTKNFAGDSDEDTDSRWIDFGFGGQFYF